MALIFSVVISGDKSYHDMQAERFEVTVSEATAVEHLDFEVNALRKAIVDPIDKVVQDLVPPVAQGSDKLLERLERGCFDLGHPLR